MASAVFIELYVWVEQDNTGPEIRRVSEVYVDWKDAMAV
jgi:hypothetical protein